MEEEIEDRCSGLGSWPCPWLAMWTCVCPFACYRFSCIWWGSSVLWSQSMWWWDVEMPWLSLPSGNFPVLSGHLVLSPPPPHTGPALISALNILEGFNLTSLVSREQALHWVAEVRPTLPFDPVLGDTERGGMGYFHGAGLNPLQVFSHTRILGVGAGRSLGASAIPLLCFQTLKIALALASRLGDPIYDSTIIESMDDMLRWVLWQDPGDWTDGGDVGKGSGVKQLIEK